jgi:prolipoprotein diacylglyceryltransferase
MTCRRFCSRLGSKAFNRCKVVLPIVLVVLGALVGLYFLTSYYIRPFLEANFSHLGHCEGTVCIFVDISIEGVIVCIILLVVSLCVLVVSAVRKIYRSCAKEWEAAKDGESDGLILNGDV